jgi:hypothetical protein
MRPVYISGAAAVSGGGFDWRALRQEGALAAEVPAIPADIDVDARSRKLMSHPARLAAVALRLALGDAAWAAQGREDIALYLGVGASGCSMEELTRMLAASIVDHEFSPERFGGAGLAACNPLFAFQLMNNFTLCHGAILNGTGGPNGAFYSRGTGTLAALAEAYFLVASGECERALAGGADSALHPVTWAQLVREGYAARGLVAGEGAGLLALSAQPQGALATVDQVRFYGHKQIGRIEGMLDEVGESDLLVVAPWGPEARALLQRPDAVDVSLRFGETLAAAPALAWCTALDLLQTGRYQRAHVISAGIDGGVGLTVLGRVQ